MTRVWIALIICLTIIIIAGLIYLNNWRLDRKTQRRWEADRRAKEVEALLGLRDEE